MAGTDSIGKSSMASAREIDDNGFLLVKDCPLTSFGIFDYGAGQLGLPGDPMRIVKVYRPESAVSDPEFLASLRNLPMIDDHAMLSGFQNDDETDAPEDKGVDGILTGDVEYVAPWTRGTIKIFSRTMQQLLLRGKKDLSLGYGCRYTEKPGVWEGQAYEVVQDELRGNHIALVGEGRVPGARVLDGLCFDHLNFEINPNQKGNDKMARQTRGRAADSSAVAELQKLLPLLAQAFGNFLNEEKAEPEHDADAEQNDADVTAQSENQADPQQEPEVSQGNEQGDEANEESQTSEAESEGEKEAPGAENKDESASEAERDESEGENQSVISGDLSDLVQQVEAVLAKIKQATGQEAADAVEGLQESPVEGAQVQAVSCDEDGNPIGKAADELENEYLPASDNDQIVEMAGKGEDASLARFYSDLARKTDTYNRISAVAGAFNARGMDAAGVASYGLKKFGLKASKGAEQSVLDAYLNGLENGRKPASQKTANKAMDAASKGATEAMDAYLNGGK